MKRFFLGLLSVVVFASPGVPVEAASLNSFTITDFKSHFKLTKNEQNRSLLETRETITAVFPPSQNRGIERALPKEYDGHSVNLKVHSVSDEKGNAIAYQTRSDGSNIILRIGDPNRYVSGQKTYIIRYFQQDVTRFFENTNRDEFYWDVNGTGWKVPIEKVSAEIELSPALRQRLSGELACYQGGEGEISRCTIEQSGQVIRATSVGIAKKPGEGVTIAVGFWPGTFAAYQPSGFEQFLATVAPMWLSLQVLAAGTIIVVTGLWWRWTRRTRELGTVVTEYLPPKNASVQVAAKIGDGTKNTFSAQLLDLAVRHYVKLYQTKEKSIFRPAEYEIELLKSPSSLRPEERDFLGLFFGSNPDIGARFNLKKLRSSSKMQRKVNRKLEKFSKRLKTDSSWMEFDPAKKSQWKQWMIVALVAGVILVSPVVLILGAVLAGIMASAYRLSDEGLALRRYLSGLKRYIGVAEIERIEMLQTPEGAKKVGSVNENDAKKMITLYEKVLPYAVLFGQEKQWGKVLGKYYDRSGDQPEWYSGQSAFNAAVFSSVVSDFGATGSYGGSTSSSSGGSSGGGYSGGGGGGGGGGGW